MDHLAAIRRDADRFYAVAEEADPTRPVPSCPAWTIADLVHHLAETHWFWATDVEQRATDPSQVEAQKPARPAEHAAVVAWGREQVDRLVDALASTPDDVPVWTWALQEADHTAGFVRRHQVQEAAVHRWDIEQAATGRAEPIDPEAAADSIDEMLAITLPWGVRGDKPLGGTVHLHLTDTEGEWFVHADGRVERLHQKGDVALRGSASDVLLVLYDRIPLDRLEVIGDGTRAKELLDRLNTE